MKKNSIAFVLAMLWGCASACAQIGIGEWRSHFSYDRILRVQAVGNHVYAAAAQGLLRYNVATGETVLLNKTTGLSDVGIRTIAYDAHTATLVVAYNNANIDLLQDGEILNIGDIRRSNISGDKSIHAIRFHQGNAYLACAFGIVLLDLKRAEIKETYYIDISGRCEVYDVAVSDSMLYAATPTGLRYIPYRQRNPVVATNWTIDNTSLLAGLPVRQLEWCHNRLLALAEEGNEGILYRQANDGILLPWLSGTLRNIRSHDGCLTVVTADSIWVYNVDDRREQAFGAYDWMSIQVNDADWADGSLWMAHNWAGLMCYDYRAQRLYNVSPNGTCYDAVYKLLPHQNNLLLCHGGKSSVYSNAGIPAVVDYFVDNRWQAVSGAAVDTLFDVVDIAVNPINDNEWLATSWGQGVLHIVNGEIVAVYNESNTDGALQSYHSGSYRSLRTGAIVYDAGGNAWITSSLVDRTIAMRHSDGSWKSFDLSRMIENNEIDKLVFDSIRGYLWLAGRANRIYVFHTDGETVQQAVVNPNNGSRVETSAVTCMVQDHDGDLWIGTNKGVKKIFDGYRAFQNGGEGEMSPVTCSNILFSQGDMVEYLMAYESITCMAVDGANRKWIGTAEGGLYLLSATGLEQLEHFTAANSPLLSNKIISLAVMPESGELFIGTDAGLQSYRGTATYATATPEETIHVFPNPVRPDYRAPIAIKGFSRNALVHITDVAGHTLFSTTAYGGQAIWNGCTNEGLRVPTGVYFVFASDVDGKARAVAKILFVQ